MQNNLDFLIGMTESMAYEIAQEHGFVVRIVERDGVHFVVTRDFRTDRINFVVKNNLLISYTIG